MARRSLKSQLNQIRSWVREGRTNAWIAHQLEVPVRDIDGFKREHDLAPAAADPAGDGDAPRAPEEVDLRAEDDALVAAELDAEPIPPLSAEEAQEDEGAARRRRRGRRGGTRTRRAAGEGLEGTFDHGEEGYGLWLDPAVQDDPVYAEHWAGHRPVTVSVEPDQIVIRRAGEDGDVPAVAEAAAPPEPAEAPPAEEKPKPRRRSRSRKAAAPPPDPEPESGPNPDDFDA